MTDCNCSHIFANLLLLLGVTFVPFPTSVLASHLGKADQVAATALFNGTYFWIAIFFNVLWRYALHRRLLDNARPARGITVRYARGPLIYLVCFGLSWISVPASLGLNIALAVFFAMPPNSSN